MGINQNNIFSIDVYYEIYDLFSFNSSLLFRKFWFQFTYAMSFFSLVTLPITATNNYSGLSQLLITRFVLPLIVLSSPLLTYLQVRNAMNKDNNIHKRFSFCFSYYNIECSVNMNTSHTQWSEVTKAEETKRYFWIFTGPNKSFIIPKRSLSSEDQVSEFKDLLRSKLDRKKLELKR